MEVGLGAGWYEAEFRAFGIPFLGLRQRLDMLEEGMQVIRLLFEQDRASFSGEYYKLEDAICRPRPLQARPRLWVGGNGRQRTLRIAARHADGWNSPYPSVDEFRELSGVLDRWCEREGRDPAAIERNVNLSFHLAADRASLPAAEAHFQESWGPAAELFRTRGTVVGLPEQAIESVGRYADAGVRRVCISVRPPLNWDALYAWADEVIPAFS